MNYPHFERVTYHVTYSSQNNNRNVSSAFPNSHKRNATKPSKDSAKQLTRYLGHSLFLPFTKTTYTEGMKLAKNVRIKTEESLKSRRMHFIRPYTIEQSDLVLKTEPQSF